MGPGLEQPSASCLGVCSIGKVLRLSQPGFNAVKPFPKKSPEEAEHRATSCLSRLPPGWVSALGCAKPGSSLKTGSLPP